MKIFIKDIPVIIISNQESIQTSDYDQIFNGKNQELDFVKLSGEVLIKNSPTDMIDQFMVFLKQNNIKKLQEITFSVKDYDTVIKAIKAEYLIIKAAGGLILNEGEVLLIWRLSTTREKTILGPLVVDASTESSVCLKRRTLGHMRIVKLIQGVFP